MLKSPEVCFQFLCMNVILPQRSSIKMCNTPVGPLGSSIGQGGLVYVPALFSRIEVRESWKKLYSCWILTSSRFRRPTGATNICDDHPTTASVRFITVALLSASGDDVFMFAAQSMSLTRRGRCSSQRHTAAAERPTVSRTETEVTGCIIIMKRADR